MKWIVAAVASGCAALVAGPAAATSFDCAKSATPTERAICGSPRLAQLDDQLAARYGDLFDTAVFGAEEGNPVVTALRASQRRWLEMRNRCGADTLCIERAYGRRMGALVGDVASQEKDPIAPFLGEFTDNPSPGAAIDITVVGLDAHSAVVVVEASSSEVSCQDSAVAKMDDEGRLIAGFEGFPVRLVRLEDGIEVAKNQGAGLCGPRIDLARRYGRAAHEDERHRVGLATDYGSVTLLIDPRMYQVKGRFPDYSGRLFGRLAPDGSSISGEWVEPNDDHPCATANHGSTAWGRFVFSYSNQFAAGDAMTGAWGYCDDGLNQTWNGKVVEVQ